MRAPNLKLTLVSVAETRTNVVLHASPWCRNTARRRRRNSRSICEGEQQFSSVIEGINRVAVCCISGRNSAWAGKEAFTVKRRYAEKPSVTKQNEACCSACCQCADPDNDKIEHRRRSAEGIFNISSARTPVRREGDDVMQPRGDRSLDRAKQDFKEACRHALKSGFSRSREEQPVVLMRRFLIVPFNFTVYTWGATFPSRCASSNRGHSVLA